MSFRYDIGFTGSEGGIGVNYAQYIKNYYPSQNLLTETWRNEVVLNIPITGVINEGGQEVVRSLIFKESQTSLKDGTH